MEICHFYDNVKDFQIWPSYVKDIELKEYGSKVNNFFVTW